MCFCVVNLNMAYMSLTGLWLCVQVALFVCCDYDCRANAVLGEVTSIVYFSAFIQPGIDMG